MESRLVAIHKRYASDTVFLAKLDTAQRAWQRFAEAELTSVTEYRPPQTYRYTAWRAFRIDRSGTTYSWS
jgi:hypothetical protein